VKRFHFLAIGSALVLFAFTLLHPAIALAQPDLTGADQTAVFAQLGTGWFTTLQGMAARLYGALFTLEVIVVCIQGALYKDNVAEFFQGFAFKILTATVMLAVIGNAGVIFPAIVGMFQTTAAQVTGLQTHSTNVCFGANTGNAACTAQTIANPTALETHMLLWSAQYFIAADASRAADSAESAIAGIVVFGTGVPGLSTAFLMGHENFSLFCIALGMTCVMSAAGILLTYVLLTFETQIVMMIGVIYLAFQGSRYTAQFSQGYMSYCINIGTKFFVFYFMVSILGTMLDNGDQSLGASIASLVAGAVIPFGAGSIVLVALSSPIPVICIITSILVAAIPNFAGSLLQGSSALSASAALQQGGVQAMTGAVGGMASGGFAAAQGGMKQAMSGSGAQKGGGSGGSMPDRSGAGESAAPTSTGGAQLGPSETGSTTTGGESGSESMPSTNGSASGGALGSQGSFTAGLSQGGQGGGQGQGMNASSGNGATSNVDDAMASESAVDDAAWVDSAALDDSESDESGEGGPQLGDDYGSGSGTSSDDESDEDEADLEDERQDAIQSRRDDLEQQQSVNADQQQAMANQKADAAQAKVDAPKTLAGYDSQTIADMDSKQFASLAANTNFNSLSPEQIKTINNNPTLRDEAMKAFQGQAKNALLSPQKQTDWAKAADAAAKAAAAGSQPPPAVQVRVTNPDKL